MTAATKRPPRLLLILVGLLLCSNLATALVAYLVVERLDDRYAREMSIVVPGLHEVMLLAQDSTNTHRAAGNLLLARDEAEKKVMWERLQQARENELERLTEVFASGPPSAGDLKEPLWRASRDYNAGLEEFLALFSKGKRDAALAFRLDMLRPVFDNYQNRQRDESIRLNFEAMRTSTELSDQAKTRKSMLLGLGGWPLVAITAMLVGFGLLGGVLWRQLWHIEAEEKKLRTGREF